MSKWSGKCDLYDDMMMTCEHKGLVKENNESDLDFEVRCFNFYNELLKGKIYQYTDVKLTQWNIDSEIEAVNNSEVLRKEVETKVVKDNRCKTGEKEVQVTTYYYLNKEYKKPEDIKYYSIKKEIKLDSILDFIPFYPYVSAVSSHSKDSIYILVGKTSELEDRYESFKRNGLDTSYVEEHMKSLKQHLTSMTLNLYNKEYHALVEKVSTILNEELENSRSNYQECFNNLLSDESEDTIEDYQFKSGYFEAISSVKNKITKALKEVM